MVKNRDSKEFKRAEKQIQTAGKMPFHRVFKLKKSLSKLVWKFRKREH